MSPEKKEIFEFGEFRLDVDEHTIERIDGAQNETLTEKAFQALVLLVRHRGHLVSRDELIGFVWPDVIVEDNNLEKCIHQLRHFLGETSNGRKYIETVRKHGYRFVERVEAVEVSSSWLPETLRTEVAESGSAGLIGGPTETGAEYPNAIGARQLTAGKARYPYGRSILVSAIALALIGGLVVGLGYYRFLRRGVNAAELQAKHGTNNEEANKFYLMAMNLSEERGVPNVRKTLEYLNRAVALDPNYALAWAGIALAHADTVTHSDGDPSENYQRSMEAIRKALDIDPNLSEAYSAICQNKKQYEYDVTGAEMACKHAVELDPNSPLAHKTYANFLYSRGRFDEAIVEIKTAMELQPVSYRNQQMYALTLYFARRYDEAEDQFKRLMELNPNQSSYVQNRLVKLMEAQGKESEAFEYLVQLLTSQNADNEKLGRFKTAYQTSGWRGVVIEQIKTAEAEADPNHFQLAHLYAKIGDKDKALEYLEKAYQERSFQIAILQVDPEMDNLRSDPRFNDLVKRVGL